MNADSAEKTTIALVSAESAAIGIVLESCVAGPVATLPDSRSIRSISYQDQKSSTKIDIDLVLQSALDTHPLYFVKSFRMDGLLHRSGDETSDKCPESERSS